MDHIIERYELKYLVPERLVPAIREAALATSRIDKYAGANGTYRIRSLYFDTLRYDLYSANEREQADRFKMRARIYPGATTHVFLEVKRRVLDVIIKSRAAIPRELWRDVLDARSAALEALPPQVRNRAMQFLGRYHRHHLRPVLMVEYEREPYVSEIDSYGRLTFDRNIVVQEQPELSLGVDPRRWRPIDHRVQTETNETVCVLELKFERRPPTWMSALVRRLDLVRYSFSKYAHGVASELTLPELRTPAGRR
jgi:SPX domain protein involved in polyphosphate accumulation